MTATVRPTVVAVDVGGTDTKGAIIHGGQVVRSERRPTGAVDGPAAVVERTGSFAADLISLARRERYEPTGVGLVVPGIVDAERGVARYSASLGWRDVPLGRLVAERCGLPTAVGHDVRAGALAEAVSGAGRGHTPVLFAAIGTGVAFAVIDEGRGVREGSGVLAGEIGQLRVEPRGPRLEQVASATAIADRYAALGGAPVDGAIVCAAVRRGDPHAIAVWIDAVDALAGALAHAVLLVSPAIVVVGGGLAEAGETLLGPLREAVTARLAIAMPVRLVPAAHGTYAGCVGAGLLAEQVVRVRPTAGVVEGARS